MWTPSTKTKVISAAKAAEKLRVTEETVEKLRRVFDPSLSFDEHDSIFPLDLGRIWDLTAFSATKSHIEENREYTKIFLHSDQHKARLKEWAQIYHQMHTVFRYAFAGRCSRKIAHLENDWEFNTQQCFVRAGHSQRGTDFHVDNSADKLKAVQAAFRTTWRPPENVVLLARDTEPGTLCVKGMDDLPVDLLYDAALLPEWGYKEDEAHFKDEEFLERIKANNGAIILRPGRVYAITDRTLHAGQDAGVSGTQSFARLGMRLKSPSF